MKYLKIVFALLLVGTIVGSVLFYASAPDEIRPDFASLGPDGGAGSGDLITCSNFCQQDAAADVYVVPFAPISMVNGSDAGFTRQILAAGDSITGATNCWFAYPTAMAMDIGNSAQVSLKSIGGQTCSQLQVLFTDGGANTIANGDPAIAKRVFILMCGTNDLKDNPDADVTGSVNAQKQIVQYAHDAGWNQVVVAVTPQWAENIYTSNWQVLHDALIDASATGADYVITWDDVANGNLSKVQDASDVTWMDHEHPSCNGYAAMAIKAAYVISQH